MESKQFFFRGSFVHPNRSHFTFAFVSWLRFAKASCWDLASVRRSEKSRRVVAIDSAVVVFFGTTCWYLALLPFFYQIRLTTLDFSITPRSSDIWYWGGKPPMGFSSLGWFTDWWRQQGQNLPQTNCCNTWHSFTLPTSRGEIVSCLHLAYPRCISCQLLLRLLRSSVCDITGRLPSGQIMWHISKLCNFLKSFFFNFASAIFCIAIILEYTLCTRVHRQCKPISLSALWLTQTLSVISTQSVAVGSVVKIVNT